MLLLSATSPAGLLSGRRLLAGEETAQQSIETVDMAHMAASAKGGPALVNAGKLGQSFAELGNYIYLTPQKLGGGTHAVDLGSGKTLAWIAYWNYGDTFPISHHLAAYPHSHPYKGFEFVNSTQGGDNVMIYGIPTRIKRLGILDEHGQGNHIYRVQYDGMQMSLLEDVSETTGVGSVCPPPSSPMRTGSPAPM